MSDTPKPLTPAERNAYVASALQLYGLDPETEIVDVVRDGEGAVVIVRLPVAEEDLTAGAA